VSTSPASTIMPMAIAAYWAAVAAKPKETLTLRQGARVDEELDGISRTLLALIMLVQRRPRARSRFARPRAWSASTQTSAV
jgi:hypothetical protein